MTLDSRPERMSPVPPSSESELPLELIPKVTLRPGPVPKHMRHKEHSRGSVREALSQLRRGRLSMAGVIAIACLVLVAVFADLLASDLPIACKVQGSTYVLPNVIRPAALREYDCSRIATEKDPSGWAVYPLVPFGPRQANMATVLSPPSRAHLLGTDAFGRDVFARLVHGARSSLSVALLAVTAFVAIGMILGSLAGFFGGSFDSLLSRLIETLTAFPTLVLVLVVQASVEHPTMLTLLAALALTRWTEVARLVRAEVMLVASQEYVLAARALGASPLRVLRRHVVPNASAPLLVSATFGVASVVLVEAALDFLRVGLPASTATWGETLSQARNHPTAWWLLAFPGFAIFACVASLNLIGEALRDALDPRLRASMAGGQEARASLDRGSAPPSSVAFDGTPHA